MSKSTHVLWNNESLHDILPSTSKFVEDKSWIMSYDHHAVNFTDMFIKAGTKLMALAGPGEPEVQLKTSESGIVRKYR